MAEDVEEKQAVGVEPAGDPLENLAVVLQVLEHLDRHDPVEGPGGLEVVHVRGQDFDVVQSQPFGLTPDESALVPTVRDGGDPRRRVFLGGPQGKRAPAAAQVEDPLAVAESARSQVSASMASSAAARPVTPAG